MGEFGLQEILKPQFSRGATACELVAHLGGRRYAIFENQKTKRLLIFRLRLTSDADAALLFRFPTATVLELKDATRTNLFRRPKFLSFGTPRGRRFPALALQASVFRGRHDARCFRPHLSRHLARLDRRWAACGFRGRPASRFCLRWRPSLCRSSVAPLATHRLHSPQPLLLANAASITNAPCFASAPESSSSRAPFRANRCWRCPGALQSGARVPARVWLQPRNWRSAVSVHSAARSGWRSRCSK